MVRRRSVLGVLVRLVLVVAVLAAIAAVTVLVPVMDGRTNRVVPVAVAEPSAEAVALHRTLAVADLHDDLLLWPRAVLRRSEHGHEDLPRLIEGGVALQVFSSVTKTPAGLNYEHNDASSDNIRWLAIASRWPVRTWNSLVERALYHAGKLADAAAESGGALVPIRSTADLSRYLAERATRPDRVGALLAIEGLHAAEGTTENLDRLYAAGYRMMGLTHFFDNEVGSSSAGVSKGGLTPFGREAIRWMEAHRVLVDVAHASPATIAETVAMATRPVVVSHTGVQATCPGPRNLTDEQVRAVAGTGGVIGIGFWDAAVCGLTPDTVAAAIAHVAAIAGVEHVGLGSDFDGATTTGFDVTRLVLITDALLRRGFDAEAVRAIMGGNVIRLLMTSLPPGNQ